MCQTCMSFSDVHIIWCGTCMPLVRFWHGHRHINIANLKTLDTDTSIYIYIYIYKRSKLRIKIFEQFISFKRKIKTRCWSYRIRWDLKTRNRWKNMLMTLDRGPWMNEGGKTSNAQVNIWLRWVASVRMRHTM